MTPDECIELLGRPYGIAPTDHSFVLESAGRKARITVESNSGTIHGLRVTLYGRSFPQLELTREGGFERLGKQLRIAREAQLGEAIFDLPEQMAARWLGSGERLLKYAKRPLLVLATFGLAHLSTFYFESRMISLGKLAAKRWTASRNNDQASGLA